ncbi:MAG: 30S ribosomal protein S4 [Leptospiraceae bacterium]|nr:30S ribosomal protein S4 [Leptospiraceae bacterium]MCB1316132.1 30S ribosomal protein S4 [Leptospiraceae bacterium]MCB1318910.1 30S ribosomal protein S4 [Leptospiraceae bacterium]
MARYRGPRVRIARRFGTALFGLTRKSTQKRPYPPGQGAQFRRFKFSEYKKKLIEKQKLRYNYGINERQLRRLMEEAKKSHEPTGMVLLRLMEQRLDNVVFRLGFAPTVPAARQLVAHGHVRVDGHRVDIPSFRVQPGQEIQIQEKSRQNELINNTLQNPTLRLPSYLSYDGAEYKGRMESLPNRDDVPIQVDEQLVVEYYAQRL